MELYFLLCIFGVFLLFKKILNFFKKQRYFWKSYMLFLGINFFGYIFMTLIGFENLDSLLFFEPLGIFIFLCSLFVLQLESTEKYKTFNIVDTILMILSVPAGYLLGGLGFIMLIAMLVG